MRIYIIFYAIAFKAVFDKKVIEVGVMKAGDVNQTYIREKRVLSAKHLRR